MALKETKIIYYIDDEEEKPYLLKVAVSPGRVTLRDFKSALNRPNYKFYFKSKKEDFSILKEEISDDNAKLPCHSGRVVSWLVSAEGSCLSESTSQSTDTMSENSELRLASERTVDNADSRPSSFQERRACDSCKPILHQKEQAIEIQGMVIELQNELLKMQKRKYEVDMELASIRCQRLIIRETCHLENQENANLDSNADARQEHDSLYAEQDRIEQKCSELLESMESIFRSLRGNEQSHQVNEQSPTVNANMQEVLQMIYNTSTALHE